MADRIRWKARHDALSVQVDELRAKAEAAEGELEVARRDVEALKQQLVDAERRIDRARLEGARGLADSLLQQSA